MKKLMLPVVALLFSTLAAQNVSDDVLSLRKSNAALKTQLESQRALLSGQIQKTDSIIASLQSADTDQKSAISAEQSAITSQQSKINNEQLAISNISEALGKRKMYSIVGLVGAAIIGLLCFLFLHRKLTAVKKEVELSEQNLNHKLAQMNEHLEKENAGLKLTIDQQARDIKRNFERRDLENKELFAKQSADSNESIGKMSREINKTIEGQVLSLKEMMQEQVSRSAGELNERIVELKNRMAQS
jgi:hypothetical protein